MDCWLPTYSYPVVTLPHSLTQPGQARSNLITCGLRHLIEMEYTGLNEWHQTCDSFSNLLDHLPLPWNLFKDPQNALLGKHEFLRSRGLLSPNLCQIKLSHSFILEPGPCYFDLALGIETKLPVSMFYHAALFSGFCCLGPKCNWFHYKSQFFISVIVTVWKCSPLLKFATTEIRNGTLKMWQWHFTLLYLDVLTFSEIHLGHNNTILKRF